MLVAATSTFAVSLAVLVGLAYFLVLRLIDLNEKEPAWALGLALGTGALAGMLLPSIVSSSTLVLEPFQGALAVGIALFLALGVVLAAFEGIGRLRGWSEVNGLTDAVLYGAAVGLGFAAGTALTSNLRLESFEEFFGVSRFDTLWTAIVVGLGTGLVGAIVGAGYGWAIESESVTSYVAFPLGALGAAVVFGWIYEIVFSGDGGGTGGQVRLWTGLLVPVALVVAVMTFALTRENRAIGAELAEEVQSGLVTPRDIELIDGLIERRTEYARLFFSGDFDRWANLKALHNRQVQLALVKQRALRVSGGRRQAADLEAARLRVVIGELQAELSTAAAGGRAREVVS